MTKAYQGDNELIDESQLMSHVAEVSNSENFGILLGAGASVAAGGLVLGTMWEKFGKENPDSIEWMIEERFVSECGHRNWGKEDSKLNVEILLDSLSIAIEDQKRRRDLKLERTVNIRAEIMHAVIACGMLDKNLWKKFPNEQQVSQILHHHIEMLRKVNDIRQSKSNPWLFTTNYDMAIEWAAKRLNLELYKGFTSAADALIKPYMFDTANSRNYKPEGNCRPNLVKIHGSVSWEEKNEGIFEMEDSDLSWFFRHFNRNNTVVPEVLVLPGSMKYIESTQFIYGELLRQFGNFLTKKDPVLFIVGYSFGDRHINQQIISALAFGYAVKVVIYLPEFESLVAEVSLPVDLKSIIELGGQMITVVGEGKHAYFDEFTRHLPESDEILRS